jgi:hypothetical protein
MADREKTAGSSGSAPRQDRYEELLSDFGAANRSGAECIQHLQSLGYTRGQARNAVYRYRMRLKDEGRAGKS